MRHVRNTDAPCCERPNQLVLYCRPWYRAFRKTYILACIPCGQYTGWWSTRDGAETYEMAMRYGEAP